MIKAGSSRVSSRAGRWFVNLFIMLIVNVEGSAQSVYSNPDSLVKAIEGNISQAKGKKAPELKFTNIDTIARQHLTDYLGKTVLLKFWYKGCRGCEEDMRVVSKLQDEYADHGLVVIYVDCNGSIEDAARYFDARKADGNPFQGVKVLVDRDSLMAPYQGIFAPMTIVIDRDGIIRDGWLKPANYDKFESSILPFVPKAPVKWNRIIAITLVMVVLLPFFIYRVRHWNVVKQ